ncbi:MAG: MipA/OmpV family protein [Gammaproteobacteria bacterium]|nr:MipA/OmpV family protein [Gammaproteobacteria bacterium]
MTARVDESFLSDASEYRNNEILSGLIERDSTIEGGFYLNHTTDLGRLNFTLLTDLGNEHDGESASLRYTFDLSAGGWNINPFLGVNWLSSNKVNHRFGVSAAEANAFRSAYDADSAINASTGIRARYDINEHWDINLETGVSYLDSSIKDSSIVDGDNGYYAAISFNYNF